MSQAYSQDFALGISQAGDGGLASYTIRLSNGKRSREVRIAAPSLVLQTISVDPKSSTVVSIGSDSKGAVLSVIPRKGRAKTYRLPRYYRSNGASVIDYRKAFVHPKSGKIFIIGRMVGNDGLVFYRVTLDEEKHLANLDPIDISPWDRPDSSAQISSNGFLYWVNSQSFTSISSLDTKIRRELNPPDSKYRTRVVTKFTSPDEFIVAVVPCHNTSGSPVLMVTSDFGGNPSVPTIRIYKINDISSSSDTIDDTALLYSSAESKISAVRLFDQRNMGTGNLSCAYGKLLIRTAESYQTAGNLYQMLLKTGELKLIRELPASDYPNYQSIVGNIK